MLDIQTPEPRTVDFSGVDAMTIATRLREGRSAVGMTRKQVADATGVPIKTLEKYENGQMEPSVSRLRALSNFLGLDFLELVDEAQDHGRALPLKNPAPALKVGDTRDLLKRLAAEHGLELVTTENLRDNIYSTPAAATLLDSDDLGVDFSPTRRLEELSKIIQAYGANSAQARRAVRHTKADIEDLDHLELIDLAEDVGLKNIPDEDEIFEIDNDESEGHSEAALIARIIVNEAFNYEPNDLTQDALEDLFEELSTLDGMDIEDQPPKGPFGGWLDHAFDSAQRIVSKMMLKALLMRQAPDISNHKAYPKEKEERQA